MKHFYKKVLIFLLLPIFLLLGVNYIYDPANLFDPEYKYEKTIADYLNKGYNVTNVGNMDERIFQKFFIEGMKECPDVVVLGSSNSMYIDSSFYPGQKLINNAVSSATINDFIAIYDLYEQRHCTPKKVIIGIAPYMLLHKPNDFWLSYSENFKHLSNKIGVPVHIDNQHDKEAMGKWMELVSLSYFQQSLKEVGRDRKIQYTKKRQSDSPIKLNDGSYNFRKYYLDKTTEQKDNTVRRILSHRHNEFEGYTSTNTVQKQLFESFVKYLQKQGVEVNLFVMTLHPIYYDYVEKKYSSVSKVRDYLYHFANENSIHVIGDISPYKCGLTNKDFNDYCHLNLGGFYKVFGISKHK